MELDFEKLYNTYYMKIYSYIMTIVKNRELAEEITQEVFFKALKTEKSFERKSGEFTWLCAIARNAALDELKRRQKQTEFDEDIICETNLQYALENKDTALMIHMYLHSMDEPYKEVFQLRIFGELSFADIGRIFQKAESWARVTYHRARLKLQKKCDRKEKYEIQL